MKLPATELMGILNKLSSDEDRTKLYAHISVLQEKNIKSFLDNFFSPWGIAALIIIALLAIVIYGMHLGSLRGEEIVTICGFIGGVTGGAVGVSGVAVGVRYLIKQRTAS